MVGAALVDSGSQADVLDPRVVHLLNLQVRRLDAPIHADLASDGSGIRLSLFVNVPVKIGESAAAPRAFFVSPLPDGVHAILGTPWLRDTGTGVSADHIFHVPAGKPSSCIYDFTAQTFAPQPDRNLVDLGFSGRSMTDGEFSRFLVCALKAGVSFAEFDGLDERIDLCALKTPEILPDFEGLDNRVDYEPHNSLLDIPDNALEGVDWSKDEAKAALEGLLKRFDDIFVDELPGLPPFRPVNHSINLADADKIVRPRAIRIPDRYAAQWTAHVRKFVSSGFWAPAALESACSLFSVPKHDRTQARFVINLRPRNENTIKMASPIPDMKQVRYRLASHPYRSKLDFKNA